MKNCTRQQMSEKLAMALSPAEFPHEVEEICVHVRDCDACQEELETLKQLQRFLRTYRAELRSSVAECPSSEVIVAFAQQELVDPSVEPHVMVCPRCAREIELIADLSRESSDAGDLEPSPDEKQFIKGRIVKVYGAPTPSWGLRIREAIKSFGAGLSFPSLALGAVAAALVIAVVLPRGAEKEALFPAFSDVVWQADDFRLRQKGPAPGWQPVALKKVAVLIVVPGRNGFSQTEVDEIYEKVDLARRLGGSYAVISPRDMRNIPSTRLVRGEDLKALADRTFSTMGIDYLLCFELHRSDARSSLKGMLFQRGGQATGASITQTELPLDRIPSRITAIGAELLMEAEYS